MDNKDEYDRGEDTVFLSLYSSVMLHQDIEHLDLRFGCGREKVQ